MGLLLDLGDMLKNEGMNLYDMLKIIVALLVLILGVGALGLVVLYRIDKSLKGQSAKT